METTGENFKGSGLQLPKVVFGTSGLGNLFVALPDDVKCEIVKESINSSIGNKVVFDSAGKYGAGLALEVLGNCLRQCNVKPENVIISNKLAWVRTELKTPEPTFEPGVWVDLKNDAIQKISYDGILECFEQGNQLLGGYIPQLISVHDPDEYLASARNDEEEREFYQNILDAYKALADLKSQGKVAAIGIGAKNWKSIQRISQDVDLDWVMIANSMTIKSHPKDLLQFMQSLKDKGVQIINSAVFHSGFLIGGEFFDYKLVKPDLEHEALFKWRDDFFSLCSKYNIAPAAACIQFALSAPGVVSIALSTTNAKRIKENTEMARTELPKEFWEELKASGLIDKDYNYL